MLGACTERGEPVPVRGEADLSGEREVLPPTLDGVATLTTPGWARADDAEGAAAAPLSVLEAAFRVGLGGEGGKVAAAFAPSALSATRLCRLFWSSPTMEARRAERATPSPQRTWQSPRM